MNEYIVEVEGNLDIIKFFTNNIPAIILEILKEDSNALKIHLHLVEMRDEEKVSETSILIFERISNNNVIHIYLDEITDLTSSTTIEYLRSNVQFHETLKQGCNVQSLEIKTDQETHKVF